MPSPLKFAALTRLVALLIVIWMPSAAGAAGADGGGEPSSPEPIECAVTHLDEEGMERIKAGRAERLVSQQPDR